MQAAACPLKDPHQHGLYQGLSFGKGGQGERALAAERAGTAREVERPNTARQTQSSQEARTSAAASMSSVLGDDFASHTFKGWVALRLHTNFVIDGQGDRVLVVEAQDVTGFPPGSQIIEISGGTQPPLNPVTSVEAAESKMRAITSNALAANKKVTIKVRKPSSTSESSV